jgi:hypothetical protein
MCMLSCFASLSSTLCLLYYCIALLAMQDSRYVSSTRYIVYTSFARHRAFLRYVSLGLWACFIILYHTLVAD